MKLNTCLVITVFLVFLLLLQIKQLFFTENTPVTGHFADKVIILDPGHGGEDGGAVSNTGTVESHINLAIVLQLEQLLLFYGTEPVLLREQDISLHDPGLATVKERKTSDLKNRVTLVNEYENALLLSIHQNFFTQTQYFGAQVFYTPESQGFATALQELWNETLDPNNSRQASAIDPSVFLINQVTVPAVLVECGFLSNPEEAQKLATPVYQMKIACTLLTALLQEESKLI